MTVAIAQAIAGRRPNARGWVRADCPMCARSTGKADRKQALGANVRTGFWHCFKCNGAGWLRGGDYGAAALLQDDKPELEDARPSAPPGFYRIFDPPASQARAFAEARAYVLETRGVPEDVARAARVGACLKGPFAGRVVVPVFAADGETWVWHVGRAIALASERPYKYPSGNREGVMYNHAALFVETDEPALVVEGVFDALAYWPDGVGLLGKATEAHVEALAAAKRPLAVVLDGDAHGEGEALAMSLCLEGARAGVLRLPPRIDPDELPREVTRQLARECVK